MKLAKKRGSSVAITHEGIPNVVMMSFEEFEGWKETLEIMADPELSKDVLAALKEMRSGKIKNTVSWESVKKELKL